jgi:septal ring factor EnvC (AmiA/AmiB activator)
MMEATMIRTTLTAAALLVLLVTDAGAQNLAATAPTPPSVSEQDLADMKALAEQGARLKEETEAALKAFDQKEKELETIAKDSQSARQNVDDMIKLLRAAQDRLGPESPYVKTLRAQEDFVLNLAAEAQSSRDPGDHPRP